MKVRDVKWDEVTVFKEDSYTDSIEFEYDEFTHKIEDLKIKYEIYKYEDSSETYYQQVIHLPFYCKSAWSKIPPKSPQDIVNLLNRALIKRYKDVLLRDYINQKKIEKFKEKAGITGDLTDEFSYQLHHKSPIEKINNKKIGNILKDFYAESFKYKFSDIEFEPQLTWKNFVKMLTKDNCFYCGVSMEVINKVKLFTKRSRGYSLEVDQKDPYGHYSDENCVACCYWCNNAKTDEFTVSEFKEVARGIDKMWKQRLNRQDQMRK